MYTFFRTFFHPCLLLLLCLPATLWGQLSAPDVEAVYGGRIRAITAFPLTMDSTRLFVTTESANTAFYADVFHDSTTNTSVAGHFQSMPDMGLNDGLGGNIEQIAAHAASGRLFYVHMGQVMSSHPTGSSRDTVSMPGVSAMMVLGDHLLYTRGSELYFGSLDLSGSFSNSSHSPLPLPSSTGRMSIRINPVTNQVYAFGSGNSPMLFRLNAPFDNILATSSWTDISPSGLSSTFEWRVFGIGPDGRLFIAGSDFTNKQIAYSDDEVNWIEYESGIGGASGANLSFGGDATHYSVYFGSTYNDQNGDSTHWQRFGNMGQETHPNDGPVFGDPINPSVVYLNTDMGLGLSENRGQSIREINDGIEAVQVKDFDMTTDKNTAWLASKSGIRKVSTYTSSPRWSGPYFPNGDGSPYYSTAMVPGDTNTVFAGNVRIYKTADGGNTWTNSFSAEHAPYNYPAFSNGVHGAAWVRCLEVCEADPNIIFAGYYISLSDKGGLFYSHDGGASWDQILLDASVIGQDVDINDIVFSLEGTDTVAYVGVEYDLSAPTGRSIYRLVKNAATWSVAQDMNPGSTSTGSSITATIRDLHLSSTGDTIFAAGTDAGINHPIAYYKPLNGSGVWTPFTTTGFPFVAGKQALALTLGLDTVYCAVDEEIYYHALGSSKWELGYQYPVGTEINFLYFDELLVGTGTGLYGHIGEPSSATTIWDLEKEPLKLLTLYPNPTSAGLSLEFPSAKTQAYDLTIMDVSGQTVYHKDKILGDKLFLNRNVFPSAGLYLIELRGERNLTAKLLVE